MKLSTRARYGLKALVDLGLHCETEAVSIQSIAARQGLSDSYLESRTCRKYKRSLWRIQTWQSGRQYFCRGCSESPGGKSGGSTVPGQ